MSTEQPIKVKLCCSYIEKYPDFTGCLINHFNDKAWFLNGEYHRENGPAVENTDGTKRWCLNGKELTEQDHRLAVRQIKLKLLDIGKHSL